jgi:hypothetical protein
MILDETTVEEAHQRGGGRKVGRESHIDEILNTECLGYENGDVLVGEDYSGYPDYTELSQPQWMSFLRSLFSHSLITDISDARKELTSVTAGTMVSEWEDNLEQAAELFNIDTQALFEQGETPSKDSKLSQILDYEPAEELKDCENPLLVSELYLKGLSVEEIAELLEGDGAQVRDSLKAVDLLEGDTQEEQTTAFEERNGRLTTHRNDSGKNLTVNTKNL